MAAHLVNTTFLTAPTVIPQFTAHITGRYIPECIASGIWSSPVFSRIITETGSDGVSFALQMLTTDIDAADKWIDTAGACLMEEISRIFGEDVLFFTTKMEVLSL
ncbi:MAG: DUF4286 family protein [Muribaculaceae bacterium]|nr:DUF4286 family protein [Muribaculaceae bacterium]